MTNSENSFGGFVYDHELPVARWLAGEMLTKKEAQTFGTNYNSRSRFASLPCEPRAVAPVEFSAALRADCLPSVRAVAGCISNIVSVR